MPHKNIGDGAFPKTKYQPICWLYNYVKLSYFWHSLLNSSDWTPTYPSSQPFSSLKIFSKVVDTYLESFDTCFGVHSHTGNDNQFRIVTVRTLSFYFYLFVQLFFGTGSLPLSYIPFLFFTFETKVAQALNPWSSSLSLPCHWDYMWVTRSGHYHFKHEKKCILELMRYS